MRKKVRITCTLLFMIWYGFIMTDYKENKEEEVVEVFSCSSTSLGNYRSEMLKVLAGLSEIDDRVAFSEMIIDKCRKNSFQNIHFSYDESIPNEIEVAVYLTKEDMKNDNPEYSFQYIQIGESSAEYNIVDHPERFHVKTIDI